MAVTSLRVNFQSSKVAKSLWMATMYAPMMRLPLATPRNDRARSRSWTVAVCAVASTSAIPPPADPASSPPRDVATALCSLLTAADTLSVSFGTAAWTKW